MRRLGSYIYLYMFREFTLAHAPAIQALIGLDPPAQISRDGNFTCMYDTCIACVCATRRGIFSRDALFVLFFYGRHRNLLERLGGW